MALPSSGQLSLKDIGVELGITAGNQASLRSMSSTAGKSTPDSVSEFYNYSAGSLSLSISSTAIPGQGIILFNTITASGPWTASKSDPLSIIQAFTSSGSGSQKVTAASSELLPIFIAEADITYTLTSNPSISDSWNLYWLGS